MNKQRARLISSGKKLASALKNEQECIDIDSESILSEEDLARFIASDKSHLRHINKQLEEAFCYGFGADGSKRGTPEFRRWRSRAINAKKAFEVSIEYLEQALKTVREGGEVTSRNLDRFYLDGKASGHYVKMGREPVVYNPVLLSIKDKLCRLEKSRDRLKSFVSKKRGMFKTKSRLLAEIGSLRSFIDELKKIAGEESLAVFRKQKDEIGKLRKSVEELRKGVIPCTVRERFKVLEDREAALEASEKKSEVFKP